MSLAELLHALDVYQHRTLVSEALLFFIIDLMWRQQVHDDSKLTNPIEVELFSKFLERVPYEDVERYQARLEELKPAISAHRKANRHHPEYFESQAASDGVSCIGYMNLNDIIEMTCDYIASAKRDGTDVRASLRRAQVRHKMDPQLVQIMINSVDELEAYERQKEEPPARSV